MWAALTENADFPAGMMQFPLKLLVYVLIFEGVSVTLGLCLYIYSEMMTPGATFSPVFMFHSTLQSQSNITVPTGKHLSIWLMSWQYNTYHKTNLIHQHSPAACAHWDILYLSSKPAKRQNLFSVLLSWASLTSETHDTYDLFIFSSYILSWIERIWTRHNCAISTTR